MNSLLEGMKEKLENARSRLTIAQQGFQAAQAELQAASADYGVWNAAISILMREEERRLADSKEQQIPMDLPGLEASANREPPANASGAEDGPVGSIQSAVIINQTETVREILRAHDAGMTPAGIWDEGHDRISSRAYLYAILKRLRDSDEVMIRRGKYLLKVKSVESKEAGISTVTIQ